MTKSVTGGARHKKCPVFIKPCHCILSPASKFYVCCGYICTRCKGRIDVRPGEQHDRV